MTGRLAGIARHARPRGPMETLGQARVTIAAGVEGDFRGALKPGRNKRQVTLMALADWQAAIGELGTPVAWEQRRVNLLVEGVALPRRVGARVRIGAACRVEITGECDPCSRMEEVAPGLKAALLPEWRGGRTSRVIAGGVIAVGDIVEIEEVV